MTFASRRKVLCLLCAISLIGLGKTAQAEFSVRVQDGENLSVIALRLYGTPEMWKEIAEWNGLEAPYLIRSGEVLVLQKAPSIAEKDGSKVLLKMWGSWLERRENEDRAKREAEAAKAQKQKYRQALESLTVEGVIPDLDHEPLFAEGKKLFEARKYEDALEKFRMSRLSSARFVSPWFYEIATLRALQRRDEEEELTKLFLKRYPQFKTLPALNLPQAE